MKSVTTIAQARRDQAAVHARAATPRWLRLRKGRQAVTTKYYGKYRGTVVNNIDPMQQGRIQVTVPDVTLPPSTWAMPCFPIGRHPGRRRG